MSYRVGKQAIALIITATAFGLAGCQTVTETVERITPADQGNQGDVAVVDPDSRAHLQTELHMGDYLKLSETVTNKMLSSPLVQSWSEQRPRLIVGTLLNNTDDENIRMKDVHDRIQEVIFNSGLVRVVDKSATDFDYIIKSELTSTRQYGDDGEELAFYTLQLKMFKLDGELVGQWSDDIALARDKQDFF